MAATNLTAQRLRELLQYDASTGHFIKRGGLREGKIVGCKKREGYIVISVQGKIYYAHRLAWLYVCGEWPELEIDHINGDRGDNRIHNLRHVTRRENAQNLKTLAKSNKASILPGAHLHRPGSKNPWSSSITIDGVSLYLGLFPTEQAAHEAYIRAKREYHIGSTA